MGRLSGKVAIVTGAAKGIGAATAELLASEGAKVMCTDVDEAAGQALADKIQNAGHLASFMSHDVTSEEVWEKVTAETVRAFGGLHVLVNNAGIAPEGHPIEDMPLESWRRTLAVDLDSVFLGCKYAIRAMKNSGGGSIINISSIMGLVGTPRSSDYNAAKGGVRLLTKVAALECAEAGYNIRVNSVHPGYIDTPLVRGVVERSEEANPNEMLGLLSMLHPIGRLGTAMEIGKAILFLASDESSFVTGSELVVDGGYTAR